MASLTGQTIASTYDSLLKVTDNGPLTSTLKDVTDGLGNVSALQLSTTEANINGNLTVTGIISGSISSVISFNNEVASYTLVLSDAGKLIEMNVGSANNLTIPLNSSVAFPIGTQIDVVQQGSGQTTIQATGGVTLRSSGGKLKLYGQYSACSLIKRDTDEWYVIGDLTT